MTAAEYASYESAVAEFMETEGLSDLSSLPTEDDEGNRTGAEEYFSGQRCPCCGTSLAGTREDCNGWSERDQCVKEYSAVCQDCVYYTAYGQLDDMTMIEVEKDRIESGQ